MILASRSRGRRVDCSMRWRMRVVSWVPRGPLDQAVPELAPLYKPGATLVH